MSFDAYFRKQHRSATTRGNLNYRGRHDYRTRSRCELNRPLAVMLSTIRHRADELARSEFCAQMDEEHRGRLDRLGGNRCSRHSQTAVGCNYYRLRVIVMKETHHQER